MLYILANPDEEPPEGTARLEGVVARRPRRQAGGVAPDDQRHRDGEIRPKPAAGTEDRKIVQAPRRGDL